MLAPAKEIDNLMVGDIGLFIQGMAHSIVKLTKAEITVNAIKVWKIEYNLLALTIWNCFDDFSAQKNTSLKS